MGASSYEFRIGGRLSERLLARFEMLERCGERVETVLHGTVRDQAELHGIIERVQSLGLELVEVRRLPARAAVPIIPPGEAPSPDPVLASGRCDGASSRSP